MSETAVDLALGPDWCLDFSAWDVGQANRLRTVPVRAADGRIWALSDRDPEPALLQALELRLGSRVRWLRCASEEVAAWLAQGETGFRALDLVAQQAANDGGATDGARELSAAQLSAHASPAVRLLDAVIYDALKDEASDIHFESDARGCEIRLRVDGVMLPMRRVDGVELAEHLVSRLKVLAELDIGERRLPQDGRFRMRVGPREIDFRLSVIPSVAGEDAVVRVLDRATVEAGGALTLDSLGFTPALAIALREQSRQPYGMLLVTGPTGSGKTTTLYAAITESSTGREKVITIEDPVEYRLPGVMQIPVNERKGLTFARGLRSILRHDPDRVMVGEIRDAETAQIAVQAALTGHLVFSTVHANNVFDVVARFTHMGLDLYNLVSALNAVLAQRLMRQVCSACAAPAPDSHGTQRGHGCPRCRGTGYHGRRAVAEMMVLDDELRDLIVARAPMSQLKRRAGERGMVALRDAASAAVGEGWTTQEELERVTLAD